MSEKNLYKRDGVWWLRVTVNGMERRESLRTSDLKSARRRRDARLEALNGARFGETPILFLEAAAQWLEHAAGDLSASTRKRYAVSLAQARPHFEKATIAEIDGRAIADYAAARARAASAGTKGRRKAPPSPATIRRDLTALSAVLTYAEARGWREGNPTLSKRRLYRERRDPIALPEEASIAQILDAATPRFAALIEAARLTGCRQDELVRVTWRGFNARAGTLEVIGKGNRRRTLELSQAAIAHIAAQPATLGSPLIFCREDGERFSQAASDFTHLRRKASRDAEKANRPFQPFRFHDLRHLFAVEWLRAGKSLYDLQQHLGHTSVKTTEIYLAFLTPAQQEAAKRGVGTQNGTEAAVSARSGGL